MDVSDHLIYVIDDEPQVREAITDLLESVGLNPVPLTCARDYLSLGGRPDLSACIVLDVELPDLNGLDLQAEIADMDHPPIVFITGHGDIPTSVRAMKRGAIDFLTKPFRNGDLVAAVRAALDEDMVRRRERLELMALQERFLLLTPREREVLPLVVGGLMNKQAAAQLGISEVTLQIHRGRVMQKMKATSLADLVRSAEKLRIPIPFSRHGGAHSNGATVNSGRDCG